MALIGHKARFAGILRGLHSGFKRINRISPRAARLMTPDVGAFLIGPLIVDCLGAMAGLWFVELPDEIENSLEHRFCLLA